MQSQSFTNGVSHLGEISQQPTEKYSASKTQALDFGYLLLTKITVNEANTEK